MDDQGNILVKRLSGKNVYVKSIANAGEETSIGADVLKLPNYCLENDKPVKVNVEPPRRLSRFIGQRSKFGTLRVCVSSLPFPFTIRRAFFFLLVSRLTGRVCDEIVFRAYVSSTLCTSVYQSDGPEICKTIGERYSGALFRRTKTDFFHWFPSHTRNRRNRSGERRKW